MKLINDARNGNLVMVAYGAALSGLLAMCPVRWSSHSWESVARRYKSTGNRSCGGLRWPLLKIGHLGGGHGSARPVITLSYVSQVGAYFLISCFICIFYHVLFIYSISMQTVFIPVWLKFLVSSWFDFLFCTCQRWRNKEDQSYG